MADDDAVLKKEKVMVGIIFTGIILTVLYIIIVSNVSVKMGNDDIGSTDRLGLYKGTGQTSGVSLNTINESLLQKFNFSNNYVSYSFCFEGEVVSDNYLTVYVNSNKGIISDLVYLNNETRKYCVDLNKSDLSEDMFLGLTCTNCNATQYFTVDKEVLGAEVFQINEVSGVITQSKLRSAAFTLVGTKDTGELLRIYNDAWLLMMIAVLISLAFSISMNAFTNLVDGDKND